MTETLTYSTLKQIVWDFADKIRDQGNGEVSDYLPITIGTLILKRLIDERTEFKKQLLEKMKSGEIVTRNLDEYMRHNRNIRPEIAIKKDALWTWRMDWEDIAKFSDNTDGNYNIRQYMDIDGTYLTDTHEGIRQAYPAIECVADYSVPEDIHPQIYNNIELVHYLSRNFENPVYEELFEIFNFTSKIGNKNNNEKTNESIVLDSKVYSQILNSLIGVDFSVKSAPHHVFADVYMNLLERFAEDGGKKGGEFFTPQDIVHGAIKFLDIQDAVNKNYISVCDITSGACSSVIEMANQFVQYKLALDPEANENELREKVDIITGEKNIRSGAIGKANVALHDYQNHIHYDKNSILEYNEGLGNYQHTIDFAFANPPYGLKDYGESYAQAHHDEALWAYGVPKKGDGDYAFMEILLSMLNDTGKAVIVLPMGTLFKNTTKNIRKNLLDTGWIEGIIALPGNLFRTTSIPVCIWVINKNRQDQHLITEDNNKPGVMLINAVNDFDADGKFNRWSDVHSDHAYDVFKEKRDIEGYSRYVDFKTIEDNDFNLSIDKYIDSDEPEEAIDIDKLEDDISKLQNELFGDLIDLTKTFMSVKE